MRCTACSAYRWAWVPACFRGCLDGCTDTLRTQGVALTSWFWAEVVAGWRHDLGGATGCTTGWIREARGAAADASGLTGGHAHARSRSQHDDFSTRCDFIEPGGIIKPKHAWVYYYGSFTVHGKTANASYGLLPLLGFLLRLGFTSTLQQEMFKLQFTSL